MIHGAQAWCAHLELDNKGRGVTRGVIHVKASTNTKGSMDTTGSVGHLGR
jgi:hypothetical protein